MDQAVMDNANFILELVGNFGSLGVIIWLVVRTQNNTIPRLAKSFEEASEKARVAFIDDMKLARIDFKDALKSQREDFIRALEDQKKLFEDIRRVETQRAEMMIEAAKGSRPPKQGVFGI
jgi:hypothetical protein